MNDHDHDSPDEFEAGCPACELNEVSLQDTGRPWAYRLYQHPSHAATRRHFEDNPLPGQRSEQHGRVYHPTTREDVRP